jgi:endonuclease III
MPAKKTLDPEKSLVEKASRVYEILLQTYGEKPLIPRREPMHELISTMLSHRTNAANENLAYARMWERFGSWEAIRDAPVDALTEAISPSTFPEAKAPNIKATLQRIIEERGEANIDFLKDLSVEEGLAWLTSLPGVGIKTATLVLLFCFAKPIMPVDTHVHRVSGRIGLIAAKISAEAAHWELLALLPNDPYVLYNFHTRMLKHGQVICTYNHPKCGQCPLLALCNYGQMVMNQQGRL